MSSPAEQLAIFKGMRRTLSCHLFPKTLPPALKANAGSKAAAKNARRGEAAERGVRFQLHPP